LGFSAWAQQGAGEVADHPERGESHDLVNYLGHGDPFAYEDRARAPSPFDPAPLPR
jgi:hypothetical protein